MNRYNLDILKIKTLISKGFDAEKLANYFSCSKTWIYSFCKKNNIKLSEKEDFIGKSWGYLKVLSQSKNNKYQQRSWLCKCKCGKEVILTSTSIKKEHTKSCGCWNYFHRKERKNWCGYKDLSGRMWGNIKRNAKKRNLEFNITIKQVWKLYEKQNRKCALSGLDIIFADTVKNHELRLTTASLDRIDNTKGYIKNNIQWIHKDINWMKQDFKQEYFIEICKKIAEKNK